MRNKTLDAGLCIDDPNASIGGDLSDRNFEMIYVGVTHCHEYSQNCASAEEAANYWKKEATLIMILQD